ncbi:MAG: hypothetical protein FWH43_04290, partial [Endomicrobia bacterium]|nr:hypothetical protein [Endomicrobiia bacterium]
MKIINLIGGAKYRLKEVFSSAGAWFAALNPVKVTALIVINCFLLTSVYGQGVAALIEDSRENRQFNQIFEDFTLPYSYGKITSSSFSGSDTVVINIQDLHSHAGVQKNISKIIETFDKKFGVSKVYLEGAYGEVDTSWLTAVSNTELGNKILDAMLESGRLTGAEYYSAVSGRPNVIKGLENKDEYLQNLKRFGSLLESQSDINMVLDSMSEDMQRLKSIYHNRQQKKIDELSMQYGKGQIEPRRYFALLYRHTDKLGIDIEKYENINAYKELLAVEKRLDYKRVSVELNAFVLKLKEFLPFSAYKMILDSTNNFSEADKLYIYLMKISKEYDLDLQINYSHLYQFFNYIELSQKINPLELIKEEQKLTEEINDRFSTNASEREVVFLTGFHKYYRDFLSSKITSDDYAYYEANKDEFKRMWVKYIDNKKLAMLSEYENLAEDFYTVNMDRNKYFFDNIDGLENAGNTASSYGQDSAEKIINSLKDAKNIYAVVTGGFHTQGVSDYLAAHGISTIVITPNVADGLEFAEEKYYQIAKEQSKVLFNALAPLNITQFLLDALKIDDGVRTAADAYSALANALAGKDSLDENNISEIKTKLNTLLKAIQNAQNIDSSKLNDEERERISKIMEVREVEMYYSSSDDNIILNIDREKKIDGKIKTDSSFYVYDKDNKKFVGIKEAPREKSVKSGRPIRIVSSAVFAVLVATALFASSVAFPVLPIVVGLAALIPGSFFGFSVYEAYQIKRDNEIAKSSMVESDVEREELRLLEKMRDVLPHDLYSRLLSRMIKPQFPISRFEALSAAASDIETLMYDSDKLIRSAANTSEKKETRRKKLMGNAASKRAQADEILKEINIDYDLNIENLGELQNYLSDMLSEGVDDEEMAMYFGSAGDEETEGKKAIHLNYRLLNDMFFKNADKVTNKRLLEVFVRHELRHADYAEKARSGASFAKFVTALPWLEELVVSAGDLPSFISTFTAPLKNWFASLRSGFSEFLFGVLAGLAKRTVGAAISENDKQKIKQAWEDLDRAYEQIILDRFGTEVDGRIINREELIGENSQTARQLKASDDVAWLSYIEVVPTSGGKSNIGDLASAKILAAEAILGRNAGIFYSSAKENLIIRDLENRAKFLNSPEILRILKKNGVSTQEVQGAEDGQGILLGYLRPSIEQAVAYAADGSKVEALKSDLYKNAHIVGAGYSTGVWDYEDTMFPKDGFVGQDAKQRIAMFDEAHTLIDALKQSYVKSSGKLKRPGLIAFQREVLDFVDAASLKKGDNKDNKDYTIEGSRAKLSDTANRRLRSEYKKAAFRTEAFTEQDFIEQVENFLSARFAINLDEDYSLDTGKVFKIGSKYLTVRKTERDSDDLFGVIEFEGETLTFPIEFPEGAPISYDQLNEKIIEDNLHILIYYLNHFSKDKEESVSKEIEKFITSIGSINEKEKSVVIVVDKKTRVSEIAAQKDYVRLIDTTSGQSSASSVWGRGLQSAVELVLEKDNKANFYGQYSQETSVESKYSLKNWLKTFVGITGFTGTPMTQAFNRSLKGIFSGFKYADPDSQYGASPTRAGPEIFDTHGERRNAVLEDASRYRIAAMRAGVVPNVLAIFDSVDEVAKAKSELSVGFSIRDDLVITIDGANDSDDDIVKKLAVIEQNPQAGYIVLATNIVSIGVDVPVYAVLNAAAEKQDAEAKKQLRDRTARISKGIKNVGISKDYYSMEGIEENDYTKPIIAKLRAQSSKTKKARFIDGGRFELDGDGALLSNDDKTLNQDAEKYRELFESLLIDNDRDKLSESGVDVADYLTAVLSEQSLQSSENMAASAERDARILDQFSAEAKLFQTNSWQVKYFGKNLSDSDYEKIGELLASSASQEGKISASQESKIAEGKEYIENIRQQIYDEIIAAKNLYLSTDEDFDASINYGVFKNSIASFLLGSVEITADTEKIINKYRLFDNAAAKIAAKSLKSLQVGQDDKVLQLLKVLNISQSKVNSSYVKNPIKRAIHSAYSVFLNALSKFFPMGINMLVGGSIVGLLFASLSMSGFLGSVLAGIAMPIMAITGFFTAMPLVALVALGVALIAGIIILSGYVKKIQEGISAQDAQSIAEYKVSGDSKLAKTATSATINKILLSLSKMPVYMGLLSIVAGVLTGGAPLVAAGVLFAIVGVVSSVALIVKNRSVLENKKVTLETVKSSKKNSFGLGLAAGVAAIIPIAIFGISIFPVLAAFGIFAVFLGIKYISDKIAGNGLGFKEYFKSVDTLITAGGAVLSAAVGSLILFKVIVLSAVVVSAAASGILLALIGLGVVGYIIYTIYKSKSDSPLVAKFKSVVEENSLFNKIKSSKLVRFLKPVTASAFGIAITYGVMLFSGFAAIGLPSILVAVVIGLIFTGLASNAKTKKASMYTATILSISLTVMHKTTNIAYAEEDTSTETEQTQQEAPEVQQQQPEQTQQQAPEVQQQQPEQTQQQADVQELQSAEAAVEVIEEEKAPDVDPAEEEARELDEAFNELKARINRTGYSDYFPSDDQLKTMLKNSGFNVDTVFNNTDRDAKAAYDKANATAESETPQTSAEGTPTQAPTETSAAPAPTEEVPATPAQTETPVATPESTETPTEESEGLTAEETGGDIRLTADQVPSELRAIAGNNDVYKEAGTDYLYVLSNSN